MRFRLKRALRRWLDREAASAEVVREAGREAAAEEALRHLFLRLPLVGPSAGFADRVLARAGVALRAGTGLPSWLPLPVFRAFTALCLLLVGSAAIVLPRIAVVLASGLGGSGGWIARAAEVITGASRQLVEVVATWQALVGVGSTLADILLTPTWGALATASLLLSAAAMRALHDLMVPTRSA